LHHIATVLFEADYDYVEYVANQILADKTKYIGDDMFEIVGNDQ